MRTRFLFLGLVLHAGLINANSALAANPDRAGQPDQAQVLPDLIVPARDVPIEAAIDLPDSIALDRTSAWELVEINTKNQAAEAARKPLPVQFVAAMAADGSVERSEGCLVVSIPPRIGAKGTRRFQVRPVDGSDRSGAPTAAQSTSFQFRDVNDRSVGLYAGDQPVFVYNHGRIVGEHVPKQDHRKTRACYIHPVYGLDGEVLTADFPRDHFHHHGIFWGWPHVEIGGKVYDSWEGRGIKYHWQRWLARDCEPNAAQVAVENGWFVDDKKMVTERVWMRAYRVNGGTRVLDLDFVWIPINHPLTLQGRDLKSYGGITVRFDILPRKDGVVTVPSGPIRSSKGDLLNTRLPWADMTSTFPGQTKPSGAALFIRPDHPDYPPTWLTRCYGPLCVGWPGVKPQIFPAGQPIRASYRLWIHRGAVDGAAIQTAYDGYVAATQVAWAL